MSVSAKLNSSVLVVEDDIDLREALVATLRIAGASVYEADSAERALQCLDESTMDIVVSDINMGGENGLWLQKQLKNRFPFLPVLLITAYGNIKDSVDAMRSGAVDYLVKPFKPQVLVDTIAKYISPKIASNPSDAIAEDAKSIQLLKLAKRIAATDSTTLISGESGTGKEVLSRFIHSHSLRADGPFVAINCAAIPENMLEATLFGYEKGAFTGAYTAMPGKFEQAEGGTLLLDEISEMDLSLQAKLLRALQERELERLGSRKTVHFDVRVIATTNRDMQSEISNGKFREDLYYRLNVLPLHWPPLRERRDDILPIARHLLIKHAHKMGRTSMVLDACAERLIVDYPWPGNVRELENMIQRALVLAEGHHIQAEDLGITLQRQSGNTDIPADVENANDGDLVSGLAQHEYTIIIDTLRSLNGKRAETAEKLGISPRTLRYKLARMREAGINIDVKLRA